MKLDYKVFQGQAANIWQKKSVPTSNCELGAMNTTRFSDGEFAVS